MRLHLQIGVVLSLMAMAVSTEAASRRLILQVEKAPVAWSDCRLTECLVTALSRDPNLRIVTPDSRNDSSPPFPGDQYDVDSLLDWGTEIGGRYLLVVSVHREVLERRKTFSVPLLFQRWETIGILEGEIRLLDLQKRRLLVAEPFLIELSGSRQFQGELDNNRNDPSLHLGATQKSRLFRALEVSLADRLFDDFGRYTRGH